MSHGKKDRLREGINCGLDVEPEVTFREGQKQEENMKKLSMLAALAVLLCATAAQATIDGTINITRNSGYYSGSGGEFTITITSGLGSLVGNPFESFCLETTEYVDIPGYNYNVEINSAAVLGGTATSDPLSVGTAWLYSQFRSGTWALYNYTPGVGRSASAADLQNTIWWLEGAVGDPGAGNAFRNAVNAQYANPMADAAPGYLNVVALNLTDQLGGRHQDQLAMVPEPTTMIAGALLLLPFGASALRILRRKV